MEEKKKQTPKKPTTKAGKIQKKPPFKSLNVHYDNEDLKLEFKEPSKLIYSNAFSSFSSQDYYTAMDTLISNCFIPNKKINLIDEEPLKQRIMEDVLNLFFNFCDVDISTDYSGDKYKDLFDEMSKKHSYVFVVTVNKDAVFFIQPLNRVDYKNIFNNSIQSPLKALNYINDNLNLGGDNIYSNDLYYVSCFQLANYVLTYKHNEIKKK